MMSNNGLIASGVVAFGILGVSIASTLKNKRQDKIAALLLEQLQPGSGLSAEDAFDVHYRQKVGNRVDGKIIILSNAKAKSLSDKIWEAMNGWYIAEEDINKVVSVFRSLKDKIQVSQVAKAYQINRGTNLIETLEQELGAKPVKKILEIVGALPPFRRQN